jgi:murein DD-endopeptidase MepM/ murein hydrolase activator NlpD
VNNKVEKRVKSSPIVRSRVTAIGSAAILLLAFATPSDIIFNIKTVFGFTTPVKNFPIRLPNLRWGLALDTLQQNTHVISKNQTIDKIFGESGISSENIEEIKKNAVGVYDFRKLRAGKNLHFLKGKHSNQLIYEVDRFSYLNINLNTNQVNLNKRELSKVVYAKAAWVSGTLWESLGKIGLSDQLADQLQDALKFSVDLHHIKKGDKFKVIYEEVLIDGKPSGTGNIIGALFEKDDKEFFSIKFEGEKHKGFFDKEGRTTQKTFLKSPVKLAKITSRFNMKRLHPLLGYVRPHFGTDYAAPHGTPIVSVGNGVVEEASFTRFNGNYVKIKHDKVLQTQYLHMSRFASGIRRGTRVVQGQVIGYVGSTGLATGPHVCFRFWKNGQQMDHTRMSIPQPLPLEGTDKIKFDSTRKEVMEIFEEVPFPKENEISTFNPKAFP